MEKIFKAKRLDNGNWVEFDSIIHCNEKCYFFNYGSGDFDSIPLAEGMEIDKNTICQYAGINDSEGNRIFEGDVLNSKGVVDGFVVWKNSSFCLKHKALNSSFIKFSAIDLSRYTLTGHNIHDKAE